MKLSSLILISENYDDAKEANKSDKFIRRMMIKLIRKMTPEIVDESEEENADINRK